MKRILLALGLLLLTVPRSVHAGSLEQDAMGLADPATQRQTLQKIRDQPLSSWQAPLRALKEGALYLWKGKLFILDDQGNLKDLEGHPLLDASGKPFVPEQGLNQVSLQPENASLAQQVLDFIALSTGPPDTRYGIALKFGNMRDPTVVPVLEQALAREQLPWVKASIVVAINKIRLFDPDVATRRTAADYFAQHRSESALSSLRDALAKEKDPDVARILRPAISNIEGYVRVRSVVGYLFEGISLSSVLLIMSLGLAITFGVMGIINMAHGEMLMLGSYTAYVLQELFVAHFPKHADYYFLVALPVSVVAVGCVGFVLERGVLRHLYGRPLESLLVTWGIGMILQQGARLYFGDQTSVNPPSWFRGGWEIMPGLIFPYSRIFIIVLSLLCLLAVYLILNGSSIGLQMRAVMRNRSMAAAMGISTRKVDALTFALGTAVAGLGGCALSLIGTVDPEVGKTYIVDSFMVVVLGGVGKLVGTVLASLTIGMSNKLLEPAIGGTASAVYAKVLVLVIVILFLQRKPTGLFPPKERTTEAMEVTSEGIGVQGGEGKGWTSTLPTGFILAALLLVVVPGLNLSGALSDYYLNLFGKYLSLAILALGMDLIWGYTGILSLGQAIFFGLGAYAMGMHMMLASAGKGVYGAAIPDFMIWNRVFSLPFFWKPFRYFPFAAFSSLLLPALAAMAIGLLTFRRRVSGTYFAILTQAMAFATWLMFNRNELDLGGTNGLTDFRSFLGFSLRSPATLRSLYWITALTLMASFFACRWLTTSKMGLVLRATRDQERRLEFLGYSVPDFKVFIFAVAGLFAGLAGALYAPQVGIITPNEIGVIPSLEIVVWVAAGGRGTLIGAILGAVGVNAARSILTARAPEWWPIILGSLFVAVVLFIPDGVVALPQEIRSAVNRFRRWRLGLGSVAAGPADPGEIAAESALGARQERKP
jgi:urea ABC transporter permease protein UrtC/urea ABC transporter permease protein UrtB